MESIWSRDKAVTETRNAFKLILRLYSEVGFFLREVEGLFQGKRFRWGSNTINANTSKSLGLTEQWLFRKISTFFVSEEDAKKSGEGKIGEIKLAHDLKVIYLRLVLDGDNLVEPKLHGCVFYEFSGEKSAKLGTFVATLDYADERFLDRHENEVSGIKFKNRYLDVNLFELNSTDNIVQKFIDPVVKLYESV